VAELAEKIKTLREGNAVEAAPERAVRKAARAEKPVTARIRERVKPVAEAEPVKPEAVAEPEHVAPPVEEPKPSEDQKVIQLPEPVRPVSGHRAEVLRRRKGDGRQMTLF